MTDPDACPHRTDSDVGKSDRSLSLTSGLSSGLVMSRFAKGVGAALGKSLAVERDTALPEPLACLVERLHQGPLGQTARPRPKLQRRVA